MLQAKETQEIVTGEKERMLVIGFAWDKEEE